MKNNIFLPSSKNLFFIFLTFLLIFSSATESFSSQKKNINADKIKIDVIGRKVDVGSVKWLFEKKEPIYIDLLDSKYKEDNAVIYIFLRTVSPKSKIGIEGKLRLTYEYAADEWNLLEVKPISVERMKERIANRLLGLINYPLHFASYIGDFEKVKELVKSGIPVDGLEGVKNSTPLILNSDIDIAKYLISSGADVNHESKNKWTPLFTAVVSDSPELVNYLIKKGANVNVKNAWGFSPLHYAAARNNIKIVKILLATGADPTIRLPNDNKYAPNKTALDLAKEAGNTDVIKLLRENGATEGVIYDMFIKNEIVPGKSMAGISIGDDVNAIRNKIKIAPRESGNYLTFTEELGDFDYSLTITSKNNKISGISSHINFNPDNLNHSIKLPKIGNREVFIKKNNFLSLNKKIKKLIPNYIGDFDYIFEGEKAFRKGKYNGFEVIYWDQVRAVAFSVPDGTLDEFLQVKKGKFIPIQ